MSEPSLLGIRRPLLGKRCRQERAGEDCDGEMNSGWRGENQITGSVVAGGAQVTGGVTETGACEPRRMTESAEAMALMEPRHAPATVMEGSAQRYCYCGEAGSLAVRWRSSTYPPRIRVMHSRSLTHTPPDGCVELRLVTNEWYLQLLVRPPPWISVPVGMPLNGCLAPVELIHECQGLYF